MYGNELSGAGWMQVSQEQNIEQRVRRAVGEMAAEGKVPSFYQVAERAKVARSTLYRNPELRALVEEARRDAIAASGGYASSDAPTTAKLQRAARANPRPQIFYHVVPLSSVP